jgi:ribosomal protein S27AE
MNHPDLRWTCGECQTHGPVTCFHVHMATVVQQFAQVPVRCPGCGADALVIVPSSAPLSDPR